VRVRRCPCPAGRVERECVRHVSKPASVRGLPDGGSDVEQDSREEEGPVGEGVKAGEGHVSRADHERHR
jgi:hypothetical protein